MSGSAAIFAAWVVILWGRHLSLHRGEMTETHHGNMELRDDFDHAYAWLDEQGEITVVTAGGTTFVAKSGKATRGHKADEPVINFTKGRKEYGRAYSCCWRHYNNCNRTRIGMYCTALDSKVSRTQ